VLCAEVYVKLRPSGKVWRQVSCRSRDCLHNRRAAVAGALSGLAGDQSSGSSTMLKSPNIRFGGGRRCADHCVSTSVQKQACWDRSFGAYMLMRCSVSPCLRGIERKMALPRMRVVSVMLFVSSFSLLMTNATPAELVGFSGSGEL